MSYDSGEFICPNCKNKSMSIYTNWIFNKSFFNKYGLKVWIFYHKNERECKGYYCFFFPFVIAYLCDEDYKFNGLCKCICYTISILLNILFAVLYLIIYLLIIIWIDICLNLRSKKDYICLYLNYKNYLFEKKVFKKNEGENNILKKCFGTKEQDLIEYGKNLFICNICKRKEDTFYNFIHKSKRDELSQNYLITDINETLSSKCNIKIKDLAPSSNISIVLIKPDQSFHNFLSCNLKDTFIFIENKLYQEFPELSNKDNYFLCNGIKITEKTKNLEELNIKNGDIITICENEKPENPSVIINIEQETIISIMFSKKQELYSLPCNINDTFISIENKLYENFPHFKNENNYFVYNANTITEKTKTLRELNIKNSAIIMIFENINTSVVINNNNIDPIISIIFSKQDLSFNFSIACNVNETLQDIENKFYQDSPEYRNKEIYFKHNDNEITEKTNTLAELKFRNSDKVYICEYQNKINFNNLLSFIKKY